MKCFIACSLARIPQKHVLELDPGSGTGFAIRIRASNGSYEGGYLAEMPDAQSQIFGGGVSPRNTAALRLANSSNEVGGRPSSASASGQTFASLPLRRSANNSNKASAR